MGQVSVIDAQSVCGKSMLEWNILSKRYKKYVYILHEYRAHKKGLQILLSNSQAGPGRKVKQEQEEISHNHVQAV